jgi:hypothetical protein
MADKIGNWTIQSVANQFVTVMHPHASHVHAGDLADWDSAGYEMVGIPFKANSRGNGVEALYVNLKRVAESVL